MKTAKAGRFEIKVLGPYPCWVSLSVDGEYAKRFTHSDLRDLKHAVEVAMRDAALLLGDQANEI